MPWFDAASIIDNGYFTDTFDVYRHAQRMVNGLACKELTEIRQGLSGVITPAGKNSLVREEAYSTGDRAIQIITQFKLRTAARDGQKTDWLPDVIAWQGNHYLIKSVDDWSQYGDGFVVAEAISIMYVPKPIGDPVVL